MTPSDLIQAKYWAELDTESGDYWEKDTQMRVPRLACQDWRGEYLRRALEEIERLQTENAQLSAAAEDLVVDYGQLQIKHDLHASDLKRRIMLLNGCGCEYNINCIHDDDCARWGLVMALREACDGWESVLGEEPRLSKTSIASDRERIAELRKIGDRR